MNLIYCLVAFCIYYVADCQNASHLFFLIDISQTLTAPYSRYCISVTTRIHNYSTFFPRFIFIE